MLLVSQHLAIALIALSALSAYAQTIREKPRVPPGVDPGGVAVAVIGDGLDYTRPEIAARLARDGEGEIVGWDFIDADRRPHAVCRHGSPGTCNGIPLASSFARQPRLVVMRAATRQPETLVQAVRTVPLTSAKVVLMVMDPPPPESFLVEAAERFPHLAFFAAVAGAASDQGELRSGPNFVAIRLPDLWQEHRSRAISTIGTYAYAASMCVEARPSLDINGLVRCAVDFSFEALTRGPSAAPQPSTERRGSAPRQ